MDAKEVLTEYKQLLDTHLVNLFMQYKQEDKASPLSVDYQQKIADFVLVGGKRIRPALLYYTYLLCGGEENNQEIIKLSTYLELVQAYLLIHDDIIDESPLRRGDKTVHVKYATAAPQHTNTTPTRYGEILALLVGDITSQRMLQPILDAAIPDGQKLSLIQLTNKIVEEVLVGQIEDYNLSMKKEFTEQDIKTVHQHKTVSYSFQLPMWAGYILSGSEDQELKKAIDTYAQNMGHAFQIQDDILGLFGEEEKVGKSVTSDIAEGKKTYLMLDALASGTPEQREFIQSVLGNPKISEEELERVKDIVEETGALANSNSRLDHLANTAKQLYFLELKEPSRQSQFLSDLADYLLLRNK